MTKIEQIEKKIKALEKQKDEIRFHKEFKGLKRPKRDFRKFAEISYGMQTPKEVIYAYEQLFEEELETIFNQVKKVCWDYWIKKNK